MQQNTRAQQFFVRMLRGIRNDLFNVVLPELSSGDAKEHTQFSFMALDLYSAELELGAELARTFASEFAALINDIDTMLGSATAPADAGDGLEQLRVRLASTITRLGEHADKGVEASRASAQLQRRIVAIESRLRETISATQQANAWKPAAVREKASPGMSVDNLSACLRRHFPGLPQDPVTKMTVLPGGRSKKTVFVSLKPNDVLPTEVVIRQDIPGNAVDTTEGTTTVVRESPALRAVEGKGLPVARALLLEAENSECGAPFMIVERLPGSAPGSYFGFHTPQDPATQEAVRDFARVLARLHSIDPAMLGLPDPHKSPEARLRREVDYRWNKWRADAHLPSPILECALARVRAECRPGVGETALVHGDTLQHNILVENGKVTALLDWEFVHIGDPAQDLAYCRHAVAQVIPWDEFVSIYVAAGGKPVSEKRLAIYGLVGLIRNCSFTATCTRMFVNGESDDITMGASGYAPLAFMEPQIAAALAQLDKITQ